MVTQTETGPKNESNSEGNPIDDTKKNEDEAKVVSDKEKPVTDAEVEVSREEESEVPGFTPEQQAKVNDIVSKRVAKLNGENASLTANFTEMKTVVDKLTEEKTELQNKIDLMSVDVKAAENKALRFKVAADAKIDASAMVGVAGETEEELTKNLTALLDAVKNAKSGKDDFWVDSDKNFGDVNTDFSSTYLKNKYGKLN